MKNFYIKTILSGLALLVFSITSFAQTTEFTYQGSLKDGGGAANGNYDFEFRLYDAVSGGNQVGATLMRTNVAVSSGVFSVKLDFAGVPPSPFPGADRYLDISVRTVGGGGFTPLAPRNKVGSSPYALQSLNATNAVNATNATTATTANNALQLGGVAANQFVQMNGNGSGLTNLNASNISSGTLSNARLGIVPVANGGTGSATQNFVDLTSAQTIAGNKTFSNTLAGNIVQTSSTFNVGPTPILSISATNNLFVGDQAGISNTSGTDNLFVGQSAGRNNLSGTANTFVGAFAGQSNNVSGAGNAFFGYFAGSSNTNGSDSAFFGARTGELSTGRYNSFFGAGAGRANTNGANNTFVGKRAGQTNATGDSNTTIGYLADVGSTNLSYATAIGAEAVVLASSTIALGRVDGSDRVVIYGLAGSGTTPLCRNGFNQISSCQASSLRYKTNINQFGLGLDLVKRLKPITFDWKEGGMHDLGLGAEDVAAIEPLLVTYNAKGQVEGVKYDRIGVVLINAVKEQQKQIEVQKTEISELRKALCEVNPQLSLCVIKEEK